jgi:hypothetical protein
MGMCQQDASVSRHQAGQMAYLLQFGGHYVEMLGKLRSAQEKPRWKRAEPVGTRLGSFCGLTPPQLEGWLCPSNIEAGNDQARNARSITGSQAPSRIGYRPPGVNFCLKVPHSMPEAVASTFMTTIVIRQPSFFSIVTPSSSTTSVRKRPVNSRSQTGGVMWSYALILLPCIHNMLSIPHFLKLILASCSLLLQLPFS